MTRRSATAWDIAASVPDPELPFLTLADLGILRHVAERDGTVEVTITPTYSGCPAMTEIMRDLAQRLTGAGVGAVEIRTALAPAWTSDWITAEGRRKLAAAGVAPPGPAVPTQGPVPVALVTRTQTSCPRCGSPDTTELSHFSATACKALYSCVSCREPFEYLREI